MVITRLAWRALTGVLAVIGALYLGFHTLQWIISPGDVAPSSAETVASIPAPDGQHKAIVFFLAGPGFAAGSHQYVSVIPTAQADATAWASPIFQSDCMALGESDDEMKKNVAWKSAQTLQIAFDPNRGCAWINQLAGRPGFDVVYVVPSSK